ELGILAGAYHYRVSAPRQLDHITSDGGDTVASFGYDAAGRQIQQGDKQLTYDGLSRLVRVDGVAGGSVQHQYGYDGSRVATRSPAGDVIYWLTPNIMVRGDQRHHYVHVGDRLVANIATTQGGEPQAAAGVLVRGRVGLAGLALVALIAVVGLAGITGLIGARRRRTPALRPLPALLAASLSLLPIPNGCA